MLSRIEDWLALDKVIKITRNIKGYLDLGQPL